MSMIVLQMSQQVLGVTFPLSKQRQSAALLNQCIAISSSTYFPGKTLKCARDPSRQLSPHTTCWYAHEMSLSALTESIPEKYCLLKSKVFLLPHLIFPWSSCNPRWRNRWFGWWYDGEDQVFPTWQRTGTRGSCRSRWEDLWTGAVSLGRVQVGWLSL